MTAKRWAFRLSTGHVLTEALAESMPMQASIGTAEVIQEMHESLQLATFIVATGTWEPTEAITA